MGLAEYRRKRNFKKTKEPRGGRAKRGADLRFVVQKHAASHLHYDFRLELGGVLLSWAVPKGPSLDPANKRLAMHVEDHPIEYGDFEGIIPKGEYGGGTVLLWDRGTWEPESDPEEGIRQGSLKFTLRGKKLKGRWMLVRKGGKRSAPDERHWFLFKDKDRYADPDSDIVSDEPLSVASGRELDEVAQAADREWGKKGEVRRKRTRTSAAKLLKGSGIKRSPMPKNPQPQLATLAKEPPEGEKWIHEIKFDGYRMLCTIKGKSARFMSRNGKDWSSKFPGLKTAALKLPVKNAIIDGEVAIQDEQGITSFQALQNAFQEKRKAHFLFYAFDLLYLDGYDIRKAPIEERKKLLESIIDADSNSPIRYSAHVQGDGPEFFKEAVRLGLEGIISKKLGRPYTGDRGLDWIKTKSVLQEEFVIGGFTAPGGGRSHFGALLLGYFNEDGDLQYAGRVGTGFNEKTLAAIHAKLKRIIRKDSPFSNLKGATGAARGVTWVEPELAGQVSFTNWTEERQLRHPSFQGLREDKPAEEIVRDKPVSPKLLAGKKNQRKSPKAGDAEYQGVRLSHPDKVLYPDGGYTKRDLAEYYQAIADWILPHIENRLLSLVRCPDGTDSECFFQKHPGKGTSENFKRFKVKEKKKTEEYLAIYDAAGLMSLAQMGVLEIHTWGSRADKFEKPDRLIFDLDPDPELPWPEVVKAAKEVKLLFETLELQSFVKTTGGKGLHIVVPVQRRIAWPEAKEFCKSVADFMVAAEPDRYIAKMTKAARKGKIFIDYLRNDRGATAIAPYSTRAKPGAPVSMALRWDELSAKITSDYFDLKTAPRRLAKLKRDPWAGIDSIRQSVTASMVALLKRR